MQYPDFYPKNKFKVPRKAWGSWTLVGKHVFNKLYETSLESPWIFDASPKERAVISEAQWKVLAWNFAFVAAGVCSRGERHLIKEGGKDID